MRVRVAILACVVVVLTGTSYAYGQGTTLRYKWVKGDQLRYRTIQQTNTTMSGLPGIGEMRIEQKTVQVVRMAVEDVAADGSATLRQTFESMRMELNSPTGTTVFDSTSPDKPTDPASAAMATTMSAMIGESVTLLALPTGAMKGLEGMSRILDKVMATLPQDPAATQVFNQLKSSMSDDAMSGIGQGFVMFPDRTVKTGETWTSQLQMNAPIIGRVTTDGTSTLVSVDNANGTSIARIAVMLAMKPETDAAAFGVPGMTVKISDSKSEGEILFDTTKGRVRSTSFTSETPMSMSMKGPAGSVNAQSVVRTTMTMEIVD